MLHLLFVMLQNRATATLRNITATLLVLHPFESDISRLEVEFFTNFKKMKCCTL